jgi:hypothetical protein
VPAPTSDARVGPDGEDVEGLSRDGVGQAGVLDPGDLGEAVPRVEVATPKNAGHYHYDDDRRDCYDPPTTRFPVTLSSVPWGPRALVDLVAEFQQPLLVGKGAALLVGTLRAAAGRAVGFVGHWSSLNQAARDLWVVNRSEWQIRSGVCDWKRLIGPKFQDPHRDSHFEMDQRNFDSEITSTKRFAIDNAS